MNLIKRIFTTKQKPQQPDIMFGRYTDAYKSKEQSILFNKSLEQFEADERIAAYRSFLTYLKDDQQDNIEWEQEEEDGRTLLRFQFWQGSRRVFGVATEEKVVIESHIALADDLQVGFLRRLMEANYELKFSRFALTPDNALAIKFDSYGVDASPLKLLHAFRELAIHADKKDDLLLDEFKSLRPVEASGYQDNISEEEKAAKYTFIREQIEAAHELLDQAKPDPNKYPGTYAYLLLALAFKFDYLVKPEGFMMDALERIHTLYFAKNDRTPQVKIASMRKEFGKLMERSQADFFKEMYRTRSTFGASPAVGHQHIARLIEGELPKMDWPLQQNHTTLALAVPQYIVGFALFHYAPPQPVRDLLHLFYQITEPAFFRQLGFQIPYTDAQGRLDKVAIQEAMREIKNQHRAEYLYFKPDITHLDFASSVLFAKSYLLMIKELDLIREH